VLTGLKDVYKAALSQPLQQAPPKANSSQPQRQQQQQQGTTAGVSDGMREAEEGQIRRQRTELLQDTAKMQWMKEDDQAQNVEMTLEEGHELGLQDLQDTAKMQGMKEEDQAQKVETTLEEGHELDLQDLQDTAKMQGMKEEDQAQKVEMTLEEGHELDWPQDLEDRPQDLELDRSQEGHELGRPHALEEGHELDRFLEGEEWPQDMPTAQEVCVCMHGYVGEFVWVRVWVGWGGGGYVGACVWV